MVDSVTNGFIRRSQSSQDPMQQGQPNNLNYKEEQVRKSLMEFSKRFGSSISAVTKLLGTMEDSRDKRELDKALKKANSITSLMQKLKEGKGITPKEARELIDNAELLNKLIVSDDKVRKQLKELGYKAEDLDITKPLRTASQKIGESAKELFINNAERLSRSDVAQDIAKTGVRAVSPELAFITESLGVGLPNLFESQNDEEDEVVTELDKLNTSVENLEDSFIKAQEEGTKATVKAQQASTKAEVDLTKKQIISDKRNTNDIIYADSAREETLTTIRADQHREVSDLLDDIKDGQQKGFFSKLMDFLNPKNSPTLQKAGVIAAASSAGNFFANNKVGKVIAGAVKVGVKGAVAAAGTTLGIDALRNVREEGLTSGNTLQAASSGAMLGSVFGPYGAIIGGGVGALAAVITSSISDEDMKSIERGLGTLSTFVKKGIKDGIHGIVVGTKELWKSIEDGKFTEYVEKTLSKLSSSTKEIRDSFNSTLSNSISDYDWVFKKLGQDLTSIQNMYTNLNKDFNKEFPAIVTAQQGLSDLILAPFRDIALFMNSPSAYLKSALNINQEEMDYYIDGIIDFVTNPVKRIKEAIKDTAALVGIDVDAIVNAPDGTLLNATRSAVGMDPLPLPGEKPPTTYTKRVRGYDGDLPSARFIRPIDAVSEPENDTSKIVTPPENQTATDLSTAISQGQAAKAVSDQVNQQSEQQQKRDKETDKNMKSIVDSKKDKSSFRGQRNMNTSPVQTSDVGLICVLGSGC